jgi:hypothetical protein
VQGSNIYLLAPSGATLKVLKLIKEDHFACTTRMFEILSPSTRRLRDSLRAGDLIARTIVYTTTSALTSSRFSDYSLVKEQTEKTFRQTTADPDRSGPSL